MGVSAAFEWVSSELERRTSLSRLEARGTVRLLLKQAGLEPGLTTSSQMLVVVQRLLPKALKARGVGDADAVCEAVFASLANATDGGQFQSDSAYDVFERLGGRQPGRTKK